VESKAFLSAKKKGNMGLVCRLAKLTRQVPRARVTCRKMQHLGVMITEQGGATIAEDSSGGGKSGLCGLQFQRNKKTVIGKRMALPARKGGGKERTGSSFSRLKRKSRSEGNSLRQRGTATGYIRGGASLAFPRGRENDHGKSPKAD